LILALVWLPLAIGAQQPTTAPQRVVTLTPSLTEAAFAIGAGDQVVGVSDFCTYPPEALKRRSCGGWANPNLEVLSSLQPDLVLIQGQHQSVRDYCASQKIACETLEMESIDSIYSTIERMGELLGHEDQATSLTRRMRAEIKAIVDSLPPESERPRVFLSLGHQPGQLDNVYAVAGESFLSDALKLAGGTNVFAQLKQTYPQISRESLIVRRPQVIIELTLDPQTDNTQEIRAQLERDWQQLTMLEAVRRGQIHILSKDYLLLPGPRLPQIVRTFHEILYPPKSGESAAKTKSETADERR
jgi:iron complex transport system substrate-binding protein